MQLEHHTQNRPHKIVTIGLGNLGARTDELLRQRGAANHIEAWNRTPPPLEDPKDVKKFDGTKFAEDQENIINAGTNGREGETPHFIHRDLATKISAATLKDANLVIVTAGAARTDPNQDRAVLQAKNQRWIETLASYAREHNPNAIYIFATNPADLMTQLFQKISGIDADRVIGLGGEVDRARLVQAIAYKLKVHHRQIRNARVFGQHGAAMVPDFDHIQIVDQNGQNPRKLTQILSAEELDELRLETVKGGEKLVDLLGTSDYRAPAAALNKMALDIVMGNPMVASAYSKEDGVYTGRPVQFKDGKYELQPFELGEVARPLWRKTIKTSQEAWQKAQGAALAAA